MARDLNKDEPAFPRDWAHAGHNGMSLRDYFAAQAMTAMIMDCIKSQPGGLTPEDVDVACARAAYALADAMLVERDK